MSRTEDDELGRRYRAGETCGAIAAAAGLHPTAVYWRLRRAGVEMRPPGPAPGRGRRGWTAAGIAARYRAGETIAMIAAATGLARSTVSQQLRRAGVEIRHGPAGRRHERPDLPDAEIARRYRAGENLWEIARSFGASITAIRKRLIDAGIERRRPGPRHREG